MDWRRHLRASMRLQKMGKSLGETVRGEAFQSKMRAPTFATMSTEVMSTTVVLMRATPLQKETTRAMEMSFGAMTLTKVSNTENGVAALLVIAQTPAPKKAPAPWTQAVQFLAQKKEGELMEEPAMKQQGGAQMWQRGLEEWAEMYANLRTMMRGMTEATALRP